MSPQYDVLRWGYVPGVTPDKWAHAWRARMPQVRLDLQLIEPRDVPTALTSGRIDAAATRLPLADPSAFHVVALYRERSVAVVSRDSYLAAAEGEVELADLAEQPRFRLTEDFLVWSDEGAPATLSERGAVAAGPSAAMYDEPIAKGPDLMATVASGAGVALLPMSLARLWHRKDVVAIPLTDGPAAPVGLVWPMEGARLPQDVLQELVGVVRGRSANSSRGIAGQAPAAQPAAKTSRASSQGGAARRRDLGGRARPTRKKP